MAKIEDRHHAYGMLKASFSRWRHEIANPRYVNLWFCVLLIFAGVPVCQAQTQSEVGPWLILERNSSKQPEIVSVIRNLPSMDMQQRFPVLLEIMWGYEALPNGLPTERDFIYARKLYAGLDSLIGEQGIHVMTRTGGGGRTMYYYVRELESVSKGVRAFFDAQPLISVKVIASKDPAWQRVRDMLSAIKR
jgi:hypothetical protein